MTNRNVKLGIMAAGALKAGQQIASDLEELIADKTTADLVAFGAEQYMRIGAGVAAAYVIDAAIQSVEKTVMPKTFNGALGVAAATIGIAALMQYYGVSIGTQESQGIVETTKQLASNYYESISQLLSLRSDTHAGYLCAALVAVKSGARLVYNVFSKLGETPSKQYAAQPT